MDLLDSFFRSGKDAFAKQVIGVLKARGYPHTVRYNREDFALDLDEGGFINLHNIYHEWQTLPAGKRRRSLHDLVDFVFEPEDEPSYEEAAPNLLPIVRNRLYFAAAALRGENDLSEGGHRLLNRFLALSLAVDRPTSMVLVTQKTLDGWGVDFDQAMEAATDNLRAISPADFERLSPGFYVSQWGDHHDASRMMLPELFLDLNLKGAPVAIVFSRSGIAVAGSDDIAALNAMAQFVDGAMAEEMRPVAYAPAILQDGEWVAYEPKDRARAPILAMAAKQRLWDYAEQTPLLEAWLETRGEDRFVAPLESAWVGERLMTWTSWTQQALPLLPRADAICLLGADGRTMVRSWEDIRTVVGLLPQDGDHYPPRYDGRVWPDEDQWRRLESGFEHTEWFPKS